MNLKQVDSQFKTIKYFSKVCWVKKELLTTFKVQNFANSDFFQLLQEILQVWLNYGRFYILWLDFNSFRIYLEYRLTLVTMEFELFIETKEKVQTFSFKCI